MRISEPVIVFGVSVACLLPSIIAVVWAMRSPRFQPGRRASVKLLVVHISLFAVGSVWQAMADPLEFRGICLVFLVSGTCWLYWLTVFILNGIRLFRTGKEADQGFCSFKMKRDMGKVLCVVGAVQIFAITPVVGNWVSRAFILIRDSLGRPVMSIQMLDPIQGVGPILCVLIGVLILVVGAAIESARTIQRTKEVIAELKRPEEEQPNN